MCDSLNSVASGIAHWLHDGWGHSCPAGHCHRCSTDPSHSGTKNIVAIWAVNLLRRESSSHETNNAYGYCLNRPRGSGSWLPGHYLYKPREVFSVSELKAVRKEVLHMKKVLVIVMLIIAMGLVGCPRRYYDRDRHDQDRGHDYEHRDRDNDDREHRR